MKAFGTRPAGVRLERMRASPLWDGEAFRNVHPVLPNLRDPGVAMPSVSDFLCGGERRVPQGPLPTVDPSPTWSKPPASGLRATWLGHSTVLIEIDGASRADRSGMGPARISVEARRSQALSTGAGTRCARLPPLDLVVVSHDHYDHLDYPTIRELAQARRALRDVARRRRASRSVGRRARAHHRARLVGDARRCRTPT